MKFEMIVRRYSRIEQGKLNSRTTQFSHMRINDREKGFDVSYFIITRNKSQIQDWLTISMNLTDIVNVVHLMMQI